jgi:hypothetical protein
MDDRIYAFHGLVKRVVREDVWNKGKGELQSRVQGLYGWGCENGICFCLIANCRADAVPGFEGENEDTESNMSGSTSDQDKI